jgi:cytochrome P450
MAELITHPDIMQQAQAELVAVIGEDRLVQEADIPNLPLLQAIVKETLRLHPAVPLAIPRESHEPCIVSGYPFPAQTLLIVNLFAIQRDPAVYENPDEFKPSR